MRKFVFIVFFMLLGISVMAQQTIQLRSADRAECIKSDMTSLKASFSFSTIDAMDYPSDRGTFSWLSLSNTVIGGNVGEPQIPVVNELIAVPVGATPRIEIKSFNAVDYYLDNYGIHKLVPRQPSLRKDKKPEDVPFVYNETAYQTTRGFRNEPLAVVNVVGTMRGIRLGKMTIEPVSYDPVNNTLRVFNNIEVEVHFDGADARTTEQLLVDTYSPYFDIVYKQMFNGRSILDAYSEHPDLYTTPVKMLVVTTSKYTSCDAFTNWLTWKKQKGIDVDVQTIANGASSAEIRSLIQSRYNTNHPTFLVIIGDKADVTSYTTYNVPGLAYNPYDSDLQYASVDNDIYHDMYMSRMSVSSTTELGNLINKILMYEKYTMPAPGYLNKALLVAGWDPGMTQMFLEPTIRYANTYYFNSNHGITSLVYISTDSGQTACYNNINNVGFINYTAHGDIPEWFDPNFTNSDVNALTNSDKYFWAMGNCCLTANWGNDSNNPCFGETMIRAANKGAFGYIGSMPETYWYEDYYFAVGATDVLYEMPNIAQTKTGAYDALFDDSSYNALNAISYIGNVAVTYAHANGYDYQTDDEYYWRAYQCLGDGSVMPYLKEPAANNVSHETELSLGTSSFTVYADAGSYVAITVNDEIIGVAQVPLSGNVNVPITAQTETGTAMIVVTRNQRQPYINTISIVNDFPGNVTATIGNLRYSLNTQKHVAQVIGPKSGYNSGNLVIPSSVTYNNALYTVTSIGDNAFEYCTGFTGSLTIPNSVTSIGDEAFYRCSGLTSLTIGNSVTNIGYGAFSGCSGFTGSLTIGKSVTNIGYGAFEDCGDFTGSLTIGNSVTYIGDDAFSGCSFNGLYVDMIDIPTSFMWDFRNCNFSGSLTIGNSVTSIGDGAFYGCSGFTGPLTIGNSVTSIGYSSFSGCSGFAGSLTIGNSVTSIGDGAFYGCSGFTGSLTIGNSVTSIGGGAFSGCSGFAGSLTIGNSVISIGNYAFSGCTGFTGSLTIGNSVTNIGDYAFSGCSGFTGSLTIGKSVTNIGYGAFSGCSGLTSVNYTGSITQWCNISFEDYESNPLYYAHDLYINNELVTDLELPNTITTINDFSFSGCSATSLMIPNSVITIGNYAFSGCSFNGLYVDMIDIPTSFMSDFHNCSFSGPLTIGNSVTNIGYKAFEDCGDFTGSLTIGNSVTYIGDDAFSGCSFNGLYVDMIDIPTSFMSDFHNCNFSGSLTIGNSVISIGYDAFYGCTGFTGSLTIGNSVTSIGNRAFYGCSGFTGPLTIGNSVTSIGYSSFSGCSGFAGSLTIGNSVTSIGDEAFYRCSGLTSLTIGNSVTTIGGWAFYGCSGFTGSLTIGKSVTNIGYGAFSGCSGLTSVNYTGSITQWCNISFKDYNSNPLYYAHDLYINNELVTDLELPNTITTINDFSFSGCSATSLMIPNSVITIGNYAFYLCDFTDSLTIGNSVTTIGSYAFCNCGITGSLTIPNSVISIGFSAFRECSSIITLNIGNSVTSIEACAFRDCNNINYIQIDCLTPPTLETSGGYEPFYPFYGIDKYVSVKVPCGTQDEYKFTECWYKFKNIHETEYGLIVNQNEEYGGNISVLDYADCEDNHCAILAEPSVGYTFNGWYVNDVFVTGSALCDFSLTEDVTFEARFTRNENHYIASGTSNTWSNPDTWDTGEVPTETSTVAIYKNIVVDVDANVSAMGVYDDNTITITPDVVLTVEDELVSDNASSIVIEDGGQIIHSNEDVMATVEKTIEPFTSDEDGWNLISLPLIDNGTVASVTNMLSNEYDLFAYDEPSYTWINQKDDNNDFTELEAGKGYLYANSGTGFVYSFEDGLDGWTTIDADGDGYNWYLASYGGYSGYKCVKSASWVSEVGALTPDNFMVSPQLGFTSMSKVAFWICADDANYAAEHFGLAVSTTSNDNPSDFTIIEEWTLTAKSILYAGAWYKFTVDLSQYAGQSGYLALRHFNCYDQYVLKLDEFCLWGFDNLVSQNMTMSFAGEIENGTAEVIVPLSYTIGNKLSGFNLVGNPFVHNVTSYDGYNVADGCYRINDAKTNLIVSTISNENPLKVGEGFFVKATGDNASITFNSPTRKGIDERGFVRMELIENDKVIDRLIVKKDGEQLKKMSLRGSHTELFARNNSERLSIVPMQGAEQPVSFKAVRMGSYTITVDIEYLDVDYLHLIDNFTGKDVDLLIEPQYTFVGASDDSENRFRLVFDKSANVNNSEIFAYQNGNEIIVSGNGTLQIFDVMGRMVAIQQINGVGRWRTTSETGVYIFKLNGKTQKIVIR